MRVNQTKTELAILLFSAAFLLMGNLLASARALPIAVTDYESELSNQVVLDRVVSGSTTGYAFET